MLEGQRMAVKKPRAKKAGKDVEWPRWSGTALVEAEKGFRAIRVAINRMAYGVPD
jgi:hypothetical protein